MILTCEGGSRSEHHIGSQRAVVADVCVRHDQTAVPNCGQTTAAPRAATQMSELKYAAAAANTQKGRLSCKLAVLCGAGRR